MRRPNSAGGWQAIRYTLRKWRQIGFLRFWRAMRSKNACKTCALGMGGQLGGMRNEAGRFPEVCKKSLQAMAADMRGQIDPRFYSTFGRDQLRALSPRELEEQGRLVAPVILEEGQSRYRTISWDEALEWVAQALKQTDPKRSFFYSSGRSSNEAGFLMQLLARAYGTNHVNNCSYYCHQASGIGLAESIGAGTATLSLEDVEECDLFFLIGGNPACNHPRLMTSLMNLRRRGARVIVVNPVRELGLERFKIPSSVTSMLLGSEIASTYLQPKVGGDIALFAGIAKCLIQLCRVDQAFIDSSTTGFSDLRELAEGLSWEEIESESGVHREQIWLAARDYAASNRAIFAWTMGITQHEHGVQNVQWIANLALLRGMVGKPGAGLLPIRGHSNVQGLGSVGVTPAIKDSALKGLESLGVKVPDFKGHDTLSALEAAGRGEVDFAFCLGGNLFGASPDASFCESAFGKIGTVVYLSTALNTGHARGLGQTTIILPVRARDEEEQSTTQESMFNYVRLSDGGPARYSGPRSETEIIAGIASRALGNGGPLDWNKLADHDEIRKLIARLVPSLSELENIGQTKKEFHIPGRLLRSQDFATPDGKAAFRPHPLPKLPAGTNGALRLTTARSEGQFNTVVYEESDIYRGQERRDVVMMNPLDLQRLALSEDSVVDVRSEAGEIKGVIARAIDIAEGCALMYFPEANALIPRASDSRSKTPAFKLTFVTVTPSAIELTVLTGAAGDGMKEAEEYPGRRKLKAC